MDPLKMYFLLNMGIFHCYVSLPEGMRSYCAFRLIFFWTIWSNPNLLPTQVLSRSLWLWCCLVETGLPDCLFQASLPQLQRGLASFVHPGKSGWMAKWRWVGYVGICTSAPNKQPREGLGQVLSMGVLVGGCVKIFKGELGSLTPSEYMDPFFWGIFDVSGPWETGRGPRMVPPWCFTSDATHNSRSTWMCPRCAICFRIVKNIHVFFRLFLCYLLRNIHNMYIYIYTYNINIYIYFEYIHNMYINLPNHWYNH